MLRIRSSLAELVASSWTSRLEIAQSGLNAFEKAPAYDRGYWPIASKAWAIFVNRRLSSRLLVSSIALRAVAAFSAQPRAVGPVARLGAAVLKLWGFFGHANDTTPNGH